MKPDFCLANDFPRGKAVCRFLFGLGRIVQAMLELQRLNQAQGRRDSTNVMTPVAICVHFG